MKHTKDKRLYIRITQGELVELQEIARKQGITTSEYVRRAYQLMKDIDSHFKAKTNVNI